MSAEYEDVLTNQPVVIDNVSMTPTIYGVAATDSILVCAQGSGTIKAGFAGQDHPKCFFPSLLVIRLV